MSRCVTPAVIDRPNTACDCDTRPFPVKPTRSHDDLLAHHIAQCVIADCHALREARIEACDTLQHPIIASCSIYYDITRQVLLLLCKLTAAPEQ